MNRKVPDWVDSAHLCLENSMIVKFINHEKLLISRFHHATMDPYLTVHSVFFNIHVFKLS